MQLIITATNFSKVATNAVHYACALAATQNAKVVILHSFVMPVLFTDVPIPASLVDDEQKDATNLINQLVAELQAKHPGLDVSGKVVYGNTLDILANLADDISNPWMMVIGNSGMSDENIWSESVLMDALRGLTCPVLAVPPGVSYAPVGKLAFAMDSKPAGYGLASQQLASVVAALGAAFHIIHAATPDEANKPEPAQNPAFEALKPVYHKIAPTADTDSSILEFVSSNGMGMLAVMPRRHSFFDALLHKSHTKELVHHCPVPILAVHEDQ